MCQAWEFLDCMKKVNCEPDNFTYSTLIKGIKSEATDLNRAFDLLEELKTRETIAPDEILYNCLLDACISAKQLDRALTLFEDMKKSDCKPDEISYNTVIKGCS